MAYTTNIPQNQLGNFRNKPPEQIEVKGFPNPNYKPAFKSKTKRKKALSEQSATTKLNPFATM